MADNYLEKKMEEHRAGTRPSYRPKLTPRGTRPGELLVKFTPCRIDIPGASEAPLREAVSELAGIGFNVLFSGFSVREGNLLAQSSGAKFIPENTEFPACDTPAITLSEISQGVFRLVSPAGSAVITEEASSVSATVKSIIWSAVMLANLNHNQENMLGNIKIEGYSF